ncbi:hypothetical protein ACFQ71_38970, partial [Streptomyces sp. NPDC056534]|uniref:hypothetical protein n=1 Tax=Streptomyces sp. NPDC056534 TaxID=3345857 RepID=UPI0036A28744
QLPDVFATVTLPSRAISMITDSHTKTPRIGLQALDTAHRELSAAIRTARTAGIPVHSIAEHTSLDTMTVRNTLAIPPTRTPASRP